MVWLGEYSQRRGKTTPKFCRLQKTLYPNNQKYLLSNFEDIFICVSFVGNVVGIFFFLCQVTGATSGPIVGSNFGLLLSNAQRIKKEMEDDFVSVEHLLLAFLSDDRFGRLLFNDIRLNEKDLKDAVKAVRGHQRVTDQSMHSLMHSNS